MIVAWVAICVGMWIARGSANAQSITISEINYKSDATVNPGDWLELYNFGATPIVLDGWSIVDTGAGSVPFVMPVGTNLAAGAYLVLCRNSTFGNFVNTFPGVSNRIPAFTYKLNGIDQIILKDAANNQVLSFNYSSIDDWPDGPDGEGRTLQLRNESSNTGLSIASNWRDGCMFGSPGTAPQGDCNDAIIVSEINYNSDSLKDQGEFVEFYNRTSSPINLAGYYMRDRWDSVLNTFTFPAGTVLGPNDYIVVSNDSTAFKKWHNIVPGKFFANFPYSLNNGGEVIRLYKPNNQLLYSIHYNDSIPWTDSADGEGYTLEFKNYAWHCNEGKNWFAGCLGGSPFKAYTTPCQPFYPLGLQGSSTQPVSIIPNPAQELIRVEGISISDIQSVSISDASGKVIMRQASIGADGINVSYLPCGCYFMHITATGKSFHSKFIKQ
ncbi:MAG: hypothetical protein RL660_2025 [Bacteroidota bacterium]|jgi:hypothetical protein